MRDRPVAGVIPRFTGRGSRLRASARNRRRRFAGVVAIAAIMLLVTACNPGLVTSIAGNGTAGNSGDGGKATDASLNQPGSLAVLPDGSYDVLDVRACVIRHVSVSGTISTIAGTGTCGYSGDGGPATAAQIQPNAFDLTPSGQLALDPAGNLYLADGGNRRIRRIATDGTITTIAGDGAGNCADGSSEMIPEDLAFGPDGTFYVGCANGVYKVMPDGALQAVISITAAFTFLSAMTVDQAGNIYYADNTGLVHERTPNGTVTNFASVPNLGFVQTLPSGFGNQDVVGINGLSVGPDGSVYAALGPVLQTNLQLDGLAGMFSYDAVLRLGPGTARLIAGNNGPDPGTGTQSGYGPQLAITPYGIAATAQNALLISSAHNVYTLQDANTAQPWSGTPCINYVIPAGSDLSNIDLAGHNFFRCVIVGVNFSNTNLSGANFQHAILANDNFSGADLSGADLNGAAIANDNLSGTDLSGAALDRPGVGITGTPAAFPAPGWYVSAGLLVPPNRDLSGLALSGLSLSGLDLTGADLAGANLTGLDLTGTNLTDANLSGANLTNTKLSNTNFTGADLSGANLSGATGTGLNFTNASLSNLVVSSATAFDDEILTGANLTDADLSSLTSADFAGVTSGGIIGTPQLPAGVLLINGYLVARGAHLAGVDFHGADFRGSALAFADFTGADLQNANFSGVDLDQAKLNGANLTDANLSDANLELADLTDADLSRANLTGADLTGATVANTNFAGVTTTSVLATGLKAVPANLPPGVQFRTNATATAGVFLYPGVVLSGAGLDGVDLSGIDLTGDNLSFARLTGANLDNTNLTSTNLANVNFTGATGTPVGADTATYSFTTCPDSTVVTSPVTCIGHGFGQGQTTETMITGTVTDGNGQPLSGVVVQWRPDVFSAPAGFTTTASDGTYTLIVGPAFTSVIEEFAAAPCLSAGGQIAVTPGQTTSGINATMQPRTPCINGTVTDSAGKPVAGATVTAIAFDGSREGITFTGADGTYSITALVADPGFRIEFSAPGFATQYWNNKPDLADGDPIDVTTDSISIANATLVPSG